MIFGVPATFSFANFYINIFASINVMPSFSTESAIASLIEGELAYNDCGPVP